MIKVIFQKDSRSQRIKTHEKLILREQFEEKFIFLLNFAYFSHSLFFLSTKPGDKNLGSEVGLYGVRRVCGMRNYRRIYDNKY